MDADNGANWGACWGAGKGGKGVITAGIVPCAILQVIVKHAGSRFYIRLGQRALPFLDGDGCDHGEVGWHHAAYHAEAARHRVDHADRADRQTVAVDDRRAGIEADMRRSQNQRSLAASSTTIGRLCWMVKRQKARLRGVSCVASPRRGLNHWRSASSSDTSAMGTWK
ncbi:hypothetical protein [Azospirillum lipoferum]|uniref:hypothetical protein n=1 Tax=Azospirillum lipoferum TaxID=193 RepID=UPI0013960439|nr:hypothetical protein [Azospirillum lipoferum]